MGCSSSKLEEEEAVKVCHDRKIFVKKAIAQRNLLASSHVAYVQSLRRVSLALFYYYAEDEHLYFLESTCKHQPCSPEKVLVINYLRPGGTTVFPLEQWPETAETVRVDGFFGVDPHFFHSSYHDVINNTPASPQPQQWGFFWDPFSSLTDHRYANHGIERLKEDQEGERIPELEEETDGEEEGKTEEVKEEKVEQEEELEPKEKEKVVDVNNELRVLASAEVEEQSTPGFTVYVDRPPTSMAEAMRDIQGHFMKIVETANEVSVLLEVVPDQKKVQPSVPREDGVDEQAIAEVSQEPFELFKSHKASLDRIYEWEKKLYEEVKAGERVRLSYEKKCALLRSQDANGAEPFAVDRTRAAIRDLQTKLNISFTSVESVSKRITAVRDDELLPQLVQLIRGLARIWRVITDAHRMQKRVADEASVLLLSTSRSAAGGDGSMRGPPPPPGPTRAVTAASALGAELRAWRAALEAWAESQRAYAAALWGWARSCVKDGEDMPRVLVGWARAVEAVDVEAVTKAIEVVAVQAAAIALAGRRRNSEEWNEEEGKKKVCVGLATALASMVEAGSAASAAYEELLVELEERERDGGNGESNNSKLNLNL